MPRIPLTHNGKFPMLWLTKREFLSAGLCFAETAKEKDIPLLFKMLEHSYWPVYHGAAIALGRLGRQKELDKLVERAIRKAQEGENVDGFLDAIYVLDQSLFGKQVNRLPVEASFGETGR